MKKVSMFLVGMMILSVQVMNAQNQVKDNFAGKWELLVDSSDGDQKLIVNLQRIDGKLSGEVTVENAKPVKIIKVAETEKSVTIYFKSESSGYEVDLFIVKKNDDEVTGSIMNFMFDIKGKRSSPNTGRLN